MAMTTPGELMEALMSNLYAVLTNDDTINNIARNKSVSWFLPGLPFLPTDFDFCSKGLRSDEADADEVHRLYTQAYNISKLFDFIPDTFVESDKLSQTIFTTSQDTISSVYGDILMYSQVVAQELTPEQKEKIEKFRNLMSVTKEVEKVDLITDAVTIEQVTDDTPLTIAYFEKQAEYEMAFLEYANLIIDGLSATGKDPEAVRRVQAAARLTNLYKNKVDSVYKRWISQGYKNEYEQMNAYINQITQRDMVLYKDRLQARYDGGLLTNPAIGGDTGNFYYTSLLPGNFVNGGWLGFTFYEQDYNTHYEKTVKKGGGSAGVNLGVVRFGGSGGSSKTELHKSMDYSKFRLSFEFAQAVISRPFMDPGLFSMQGWRLGPEWFEQYPNQVVSDGTPDKPQGRLVSYPITALFIRDVRIESSEMASQFDELKQQTSGGGSVGWGPVRIGGSYSYGKEERDSSFHLEKGVLRIPGIQLIGVINHTVPKCPNTNPDIPDERFV